MAIPKQSKVHIEIYFGCFLEPSDLNNKDNNMKFKYLHRLKSINLLLITIRIFRSALTCWGQIQPSQPSCQTTAFSQSCSHSGQLVAWTCSCSHCSRTSCYCNMIMLARQRSPNESCDRQSPMPKLETAFVRRCVSEPAGSCWVAYTQQHGCSKESPQRN